VDPSRLELSESERVARTQHLSQAFPQLDPRDRDLLADAASVHRVSHAVPVLQTGDPVESLMLIVDGLLLVRRSDQVTDILGPGEFVGLAEFILGTLSSFSVDAPEPTSLLVIPGGAVEQVARAAHGVWREIAHHLAGQVARLERDQLALSSADALRAIAWRMYELSTRWAGSGRTKEVGVPLTQEDLGTWAGVSRESTVKALRVLRARGLVQTGRRQVRVLDPAGLRELVRRGRVPMVASDSGGVHR
jgi:CRP/FNR family transcriptional regulator, cyclic AMP receptor protein